MSLIAMCSYSTEENGKLKCMKQTIESLFNTVDLTKHRLVIIDNNSCKEAVDWLRTLLLSEKNITLIFNKQNLGTARGINLALQMREAGEYCIKCDDDWSTGYVGWVEEMEAQINANPKIGILGLKRDDVYGQMVEDGELLWCHDIFGTCTMYNHLMIDKIGGLVQCSQKYGFDDSIYSVRSEAAGFKNAFMKNIKIVNLDEGGTEYTEWKKREAGVYLQEASTLMDLIKKGQLDYYYDFD
jgi:glycosyltransferase involved in cell wall biosynthesis